MDKLVNCSRCFFLRCASQLRFQTNRCFHLAYPAQKQSHYDILGVSKNATPQEIKAAFVKRSKEFHPDLHPNDPATHDKFVLINEAYSVLSKMKSRREYDEMLRQPQGTGYTTGTYYHGPGTSYGFGAGTGYGNFYQDFYTGTSKVKGRAHYYGFKGIKRKSNAEIALLAVSFIMLGTTGYIVTFIISYRRRREHEEEIFRENQRIYDEVRENARNHTTAEQIENFIRKHQEMVTGISAKPAEPDTKH